MRQAFVLPRIQKLGLYSSIFNCGLVTLLGIISFLSSNWVLSLAVAPAGLMIGLLLAYRFHHVCNQSSSLRLIEKQLSQLDGQQRLEDESLPIAEVSTLDAIGNAWNRIVLEYQSSGSMRSLLDELETKSTSDQSSITSQSMLDGFGEGIAITDIDGRISVINEALSSLMDIEQDHDKQEIFIDKLEQLCGYEIPLSNRHSIKPENIEFVRDQNGSKQILRCTRRPRLNGSNELTGHIWMIRDVTQGRLAEEMREQFVSMASHELRTPLANICAYAETLALTDNIEITAQKKFINTIQSEATRLGRFVDDLLDVTRMQAGSMTLDKHEVDLMRLFHEACEKLQGQVKQKNIRFQVELPEKLPKLSADKHKLTASLVNLLGNAVKYTPDGGEVKLIVSIQDSNLEVVVEDTGIGISNEELGRVFEKFFRSDDERVRQLTGSGIGLAFTKEVARLHGGDVTVHSELDKGTRFTMSLPINVEALV